MGDLEEVLADASLGISEDLDQEDVQNPENALVEAKQAEVNTWGCLCLEDQNCDLCTEYEIEYPHVNDLRDESAPKLVGPALQNYNSQHFHSFISRKCR